MLVITTERLILRRFTHHDIPAFLALLAEPSIASAASANQASNRRRSACARKREQTSGVIRRA